MGFCFWLIWFIIKGAFYNHALSVVVGIGVLVSALTSVYTSPCHRVRHSNFIFGTHVHIYNPCMTLKYLLILTCSF